MYYFLLVLLPAGITAGWNIVPGLPLSVDSAAAGILQNGTVVNVGGHIASGDTGQVYAFDGFSAWVPLDPVPPREAHRITRLNNGQLLLTGGFGSGNELSDAYLFHPNNFSWTALPSMTATRAGHTAVVLPNGTVLLCGAVGIPTCEQFTPGPNTFTATKPMGIFAQNAHTFTALLDGTYIVAGGNVPASLRYDPAVDVFITSGALGVLHFSHTANLLPDGRVIVVGGSTNSGASTAICEIYDPVTGLWNYTNPMLAPRREHTSAFLDPGTLIVVGGYGTSGAVLTVELYDVYSQTWSAGPPLNVARYRHAMVQLNNGNLLVIGGHTGAVEILDAPTRSPSVIPTRAPTTGMPTTPTRTPTSTPTNTPSRTPTRAPVSPTLSPTTLAVGAVPALPLPYLGLTVVLLGIDF